MLTALIFVLYNSIFFSKRDFLIIFNNNIYLLFVKIFGNIYNEISLALTIMIILVKLSITLLN